MTYIPDKLTAVSYCDGDISQMDAIKSGTDLFTDNKVIANKQHASRSGVEQPADLAKLFKLIKNMLPSYTAKNVPAERCPMKALMLDAFKEKLEDLNFAIPSEISYRTTQTSQVIPQWQIISECLQYHWEKGIVCSLLNS